MPICEPVPEERPQTIAETSRALPRIVFLPAALCLGVGLLLALLVALAPN